MDIRDSKTTPQEQRLIDEQFALLKENRTLTTKVTLGGAFVQMWIKAYDALLHHGINVRDLPEYNDTGTLDRAIEVFEQEGGSGSRIIEYIKRVGNAIDARVRRKGLKPVE